MTLAALMLPEFDDEMARTRRMLAALPADRMAWKPHEALHTIGWNANHIVEIVGWTQVIISESEFDMAPVGGRKYETPDIQDPAVLLGQFDENVVAARASIAGATDAVLAQPWSLKSGGETLFTISKGACLRTWVFNHTVHHRAILSAGLRMCGVNVAGAYDE